MEPSLKQSHTWTKLIIHHDLLQQLKESIRKTHHQIRQAFHCRSEFCWFLSPGCTPCKLLLSHWESREQTKWELWQSSWWKTESEGTPLQGVLASLQHRPKLRPACWMTYNRGKSRRRREECQSPQEKLRSQWQCTLSQSRCTSATAECC